MLTLTTDFGLRDAYVAAVKGVVMAVSPDTRVVDITHEISPQDVMEAAFVLRQAVPFFPAGSIHLVVVDPGVGTERRPVALRHQAHTYVGPDNGLFSLLLGTDTPDELVVLDRPAFWRKERTSATFHGRDIFAPVAAHLAAGRALNEVGSPAETLQRLHWALPIHDEQGIRGWVVHVDHFGNCITNIPASVLPDPEDRRPLRCFVGTTILTRILTTYGEAVLGEPLALVGSSGFLEIAVNTGNASDLLDIRKGTPVNVVFLDEK